MVSMELCYGMTEIVGGIEVGVVPHPTACSQVTPASVNEAYTSFPSGNESAVVNMGNYGVVGYVIDRSIVPNIYGTVCHLVTASGGIAHSAVSAAIGVNTCHHHGDCHHYCEKCIACHNRKCLNG